MSPALARPKRVPGGGGRAGAEHDGQGAGLGHGKYVCVCVCVHARARACAYVCKHAEGGGSGSTASDSEGRPDGGRGVTCRSASMRTGPRAGCWESRESRVRVWSPALTTVPDSAAI